MTDKDVIRIAESMRDTADKAIRDMLNSSVSLPITSGIRTTATQLSIDALAKSGGRPQRHPLSSWGMQMAKNSYTSDWFDTQYDTVSTDLESAHELPSPEKINFISKNFKHFYSMMLGQEKFINSLSTEEWKEMFYRGKMNLCVHFVFLQYYSLFQSTALMDRLLMTDDDNASFFKHHTVRSIISLMLREDNYTSDMQDTLCRWAFTHYIAIAKQLHTSGLPLDTQNTVTLSIVNHITHEKKPLIFKELLREELDIAHNDMFLSELLENKRALGNLSTADFSSTSLFRATKNCAFAPTILKNIFLVKPHKEADYEPGYLSTK